MAFSAFRTPIKIRSLDEFRFVASMLDHRKVKLVDIRALDAGKACRCGRWGRLAIAISIGAGSRPMVPRATAASKTQSY
jgi:hypothetical protein